MARARFAVVVTGGLLAGVVAAAALRANPAVPRNPSARAVAGARAAEISRLGTARHVVTRDTPEELLIDSVPPRSGAQLLWLAGRTAQQAENGAVVLDLAGGVMRFDRQLTPHAVLIESEGREWISVAPGPAGSLWLTDVTGAVLRSDRNGALLPMKASTFRYPVVASDPNLGSPYLARSAQRFSYALDTADAPLVLRAVDLDDGTRQFRESDLLGRGTATRPEHILLRDLANAGHIAVRGDTVYFAPFIRDELIAFGANGDTLWIASRGLDHGTREPKFEVRNGSVAVDYSPVNLGLTVGPDDRLYLLSTPGRTTDASRLDVFDPASGALLRSAALETALPTLAADASGRVYGFDAAALLAGAPARARPSVPDVDVPALDTGRVALTAFRGRVTLVNLWASWCAPCREEMPALDSLQRVIGTAEPDFAYVSLADDVNPDAARAFLADYGFRFRTGAGRGELRARLHAPGLPVTLLVDREGREVRRWVGFNGREQIANIRAVVMAELRRPNSGGALDPHGAGAHRHSP